MNAPIQIRKPIPRGPRGERGAINQPLIDSPFIQWQSPDGTWDDLSLRVNTLGPEGPAGDAQYFSTRSQAIAHNITTGLPAIKTYGYHTPGDGGGATYINALEAEVGATVDFTSLDGQEWVLAEPLKNVFMLGVWGDDTHDDRLAFLAAAALGETILVPPGTYLIDADTDLVGGSWMFCNGAIINHAAHELIFHGEVHAPEMAQILKGSGAVKGIHDVSASWFGVRHNRGGSSTTSLSLGSGTKTLTTQAALGYAAGERVRVSPGPITITGAGPGTLGVIRLTVTSSAFFTTGQLARVRSVVGTVEAESTWTVTVVDATHIELQGSTFTNAYVSGGSVWLVGYMEGDVASYSGTTLVVVMDVSAGSGTGTTWVIDRNDRDASQKAFDCAVSTEGFPGGMCRVRMGAMEIGWGSTVTAVPSANASLRIEGCATGLCGTRIVALPSFVGSILLQISGHADLQSISDIRLADFAVLNDFSNCQHGIFIGELDKNFQGLQYSLLENINASDFISGFYIRNSRVLKTDRVSAWSTSIQDAIGMVIDAQAIDGQFCGDMVIEDSIFVVDYTKRGKGVFLAMSGVTTAGIAGIRFDKVLTYHGDYGIHMRGQTGGIIGSMWVVNCAFEGVGNRGFVAEFTGAPRDAAGNCRQLHVLNNWVNSMLLGGVQVTATGSATGYGLFCNQNWFVNCTGVSVFVQGWVLGDVSHNQTLGYGGSAAPIQISSNCANIGVIGNSITHDFRSPNPLSNFIELAVATDYITVALNRGGGVCLPANCLLNNSTGTHNITVNNG